MFNFLEKFKNKSEQIPEEKLLGNLTHAIDFIEKNGIPERSQALFDAVKKYSLPFIICAAALISVDASAQTGGDQKTPQQKSQNRQLGYGTADVVLGNAEQLAWRIEQASQDPKKKRKAHIVGGVAKTLRVLNRNVANNDQQISWRKNGF